MRFPFGSPLLRLGQPADLAGPATDPARIVPRERVVGQEVEAVGPRVQLGGGVSRHPFETCDPSACDLRHPIYLLIEVVHLRYLASQSCTSRHHTTRLAGLATQCPSSGK